MPGPNAEQLEGLSRSEYLRASPRLFKSPLLDKLSRVRAWVPPVLFVPIIIVLFVEGLVRGSGPMTVVWVLAGYVLWTLTEYWVHRVVFHFEPQRGLGAKLHWILHGVHHDHPNDPLRLVMPPGFSLPLAALFLLIFYLVLGSPAFLPFGAAFLAGYLIYDMVHYSMHHHRPRSKIGKRLCELHMRHHFQNPHSAYGVSLSLWDHVFHSMPDTSAKLSR